MRPRSIGTKLLLTLITTLLVCYRGGESTAVHFPVLPRLPELSSPSLFSASSAASKQDFSGAGYDIQGRRSQLKPSTVDDVLYLHSSGKHDGKHQIV